MNGKSSVLVLLATILVVSITVVTGQLKSLRTLAEWNFLEYEFPTEGDRAAALASQEYIPGNGVPIDNNVYYNQGKINYISYLYYISNNSNN